MQTIYFDICLARSVLPNNLIITFTTFVTYVIMCVFCLHSHILRNYANSSPSYKTSAISCITLAAVIFFGKKWRIFAVFMPHTGRTIFPLLPRKANRCLANTKTICWSNFVIDGNKMWKCTPVVSALNSLRIMQWIWFMKQAQFSITDGYGTGSLVQCKVMSKDDKHLFHYGLWIELGL